MPVALTVPVNKGANKERSAENSRPHGWFFSLLLFSASYVFPQRRI